MCDAGTHSWLGFGKDAAYEKSPLYFSKYRGLYIPCAASFPSRNQFLLVLIILDLNDENMLAQEAYDPF